MLADISHAVEVEGKMEKVVTEVHLAVRKSSHGRRHMQPKRMSLF